MSQTREQFLATLDSLLELEARESLQNNAEYYADDVLFPEANLPALGDLNRAEQAAYFAAREAEAERREADLSAYFTQELVASDTLLATRMRVIFFVSRRHARLYLPRMIRRAPKELRQWARKQLRRAQGSELRDEAYVYLYLTLKSLLEWDAAHEEGAYLGHEDRFADEQAGVYDGSPEQFSDQAAPAGYECATLSPREFAVMAQARPDMVAA
jgi:hypothetical protein